MIILTSIDEMGNNKLTLAVPDDEMVRKVREYADNILQSAEAENCAPKTNLEFKPDEYHIRWEDGARFMEAYHHWNVLELSWNTGNGKDSTFLGLPGKIPKIYVDNDEEESEEWLNSLTIFRD